MASVLVTIAGRSYRMSCDDGEEQRLEELARSVDAKIQSMREGFGDIGDQRIVVMAAVAIADEAFDARAKIATLESDAATLRAELDKMRRDADALKERLAQSFEEAARRVDRLVADLRKTDVDPAGLL